MRLRMTRRMRTLQERHRRRHRPADRRRARPAGGGRRRRPAVRRGPAGQPERPGVPAGTRPGGSRPSCGARAGPCTSAPGTGVQATRVQLVQGWRPALGPAAGRPRPPAQRGARHRLRRGRCAGDRRAGRVTRSIAAEVASGRTGPQVVATRARERSLRRSGSARSRRPGSRPAPGPRPRCCAGRGPSSPSTALTRGTPDLVVGSIVELQDVGQPFEGDGYYVTRVLPHLRPRIRAAHPVRGRARHHQRGDLMDYPPDGSAPGFTGSIRRSSPSLSTRRGRAGQVRFPRLGTRRRQRRARLGHPVLARTPTAGTACRSCRRWAPRCWSRSRPASFADPYIVGACWNGKAAPPERATAAQQPPAAASRGRTAP